VFPLLMSIPIAAAGPLHTGIPVHGVGGLTAPIFQTAETGWSAQIPRGIIQVYVAPSETEAIDWVILMKEKMVKYRPQANPEYLARFHVDDAVGDGIGLLIVRDNNLAFMVRHDGQANDWAATLHESIIDIPAPWPPEATFEKNQDIWLVAPDESIAHISFQGGQTATSPELGFITLPDRIILWDGWGRATVTDRTPTED
jgi:hypothetical protein